VEAVERKYTPTARASLSRQLAQPPLGQLFGILRIEPIWERGERFWIKLVDGQEDRPLSVSFADNWHGLKSRLP
jgi:hypothetical protein